MVPVLPEQDPSLLDSPDRWLDKSINELLRYRFGLVRGKSTIKVQEARNPGKTLSLVQEIVMSEKPTDTELVLKKKPFLRINLLTRSSPHGPSGVVDRLSLAGNSSVPRPIDKVVSDRSSRGGRSTVTLPRWSFPATHRQDVLNRAVGLDQLAETCSYRMEHHSNR